MLFWTILIFFWLPFSLFFPTKVIGKKNLLTSKCIWACNHQSNLDALVITAKLRKKFYALTKSELFKNKFVGGFLKKIGCIKINRKETDLTAIKESLRVLKDKQKPLLIFPTGTRTSTAEEVQNLKNGVSMFATKADAPIIPMVIVRKPKFLRFNRLVIGKPIYVNELKKEGQSNKELLNAISGKITNEMENLFQQYSYKKKNQNQPQDKK